MYLDCNWALQWGGAGLRADFTITNRYVLIDRLQVNGQLKQQTRITESLLQTRTICITKLFLKSPTFPCSCSKTIAALL